MLAHVRWFAHSSKTMHAELAHPNELFLMDSSCDDIDAASIVAPFNLRKLGAGQDAQVETEIHADENDFFYRLDLKINDPHSSRPAGTHGSKAKWPTTMSIGIYRYQMNICSTTGSMAKNATVARSPGAEKQRNRCTSIRIS